MSTLQQQQPPCTAMPPQSAASSIGSCFSNLDDFDLDVQNLPNVANCKVSCDCCSLCRLPEVSEAGDISAAEILSGNGTIATTCGTSMLPDLPTSPRQESTADKALMRGAAGLLQKLSNHDKPSDRLSPVYWQPTVNSPLVPLSITIPRARIGPGSKGKALICDAAEASALSTSIDNTDYFNTFLPNDTLCSIFKFLDVKSLLRMCECNTKLRSAASNNNAGWSNHCRSLWSRKANVCSRATSLLAQASNHSRSNLCLTKNIAMEAYKTSVVDAATRNEVSLEELCYDESPFKGGPIWSFRFKESAGSDWTSWDPWWSGKQARKLVFLRDGSIMQLQPEGKTAPCRIHNGVPLYDVFSERIVHRDGVDVIPPRIELKWRFVHRPLDLPARPEGAYIRITVGGRDVPTYVVRRSPNGNWGFILESCWGIYASFDLAPRGSVSSSTASRRRLRRTRNGTRWVNVDDSDIEDPDQDGRDHTRNVRRRTDLFVEESEMVVTGHSQWREALLYNIGAVALPDGNNANAEQERRQFNLVWRNSRMIR
ncbi:hypothetical protein QTG54_013243 [Skeletonema marinoi]|uniref:F-box domain-containing protein n=1 Tax=Skeletonema marinoi TaxID=267567 RepID=A0AAD9D6U3_9STRA|nr:hypothetical protein QTG54_013243 [Skeletonema marinoi]